MDELQLAKSPVDMFAPVQTTALSGKAGAGSEDVIANEIIIPRVQLLQAMSKAVTKSKFPGAEAGVLWLTPMNRPLNHPEGKNGLPMVARFVVARIGPGMKKWKPLDQGGGLLCESINGKLTATKPGGLAGAHITVEKNKKKEVTAIDWEGGHPTDNCSICVHGLGAATAAAGRAPLDGGKERGNVWLPKIIEVNGESHTLDDKLRAPVCTPGTDVLALILVPAFGDLPAEIMPMIMTLAKTSTPAGRQLSSMIKIASAREPAWAKIYELGSQTTTNASGTFFVYTVRGLGYAPPDLLEQAESLYEDSKLRVYNAPHEDDGEVADVSPRRPVDGEEAPPPDINDKF